MKLNEVIQTKTELKLEKLDRNLVFNNITLADQAWLMENYGEEGLKKVFTDHKVEEILKIATRFLDDASKDLLCKVKVAERDEFGEFIEVKKLTLAQKLFHVCSQAELVMVMNSIFELQRKSMELIEKAMASFKKKEEPVQAEKRVQDGI